MQRLLSRHEAADQPYLGLFRPTWKQNSCELLRGVITSLSNMFIDRAFLLSHLSSTFSNPWPLHLCLTTNTEKQYSLKAALETDACAERSHFRDGGGSVGFTTIQNHSMWRKTKMQTSCLLNIGNIWRDKIYVWGSPGIPLYFCLFIAEIF